MVDKKKNMIMYDWHEYRKFASYIPKAIRYILLSLTILGIILFEGHMLQPDDLLKEGIGRKFMTFYLILLVISVVTSIHDTRKSAEKLSERVGKLIEPSEKLYHLKDCTEDLARRLSRLRPNQRVVMKHIGLSLEQSWGYFEQEFFRVMNRKQVELYILSLTGDSRKITANKRPAPINIARWCGSTPLMLSTIRTYLNTHKQRMIENNLNVTAEIKQYSMLPIIHGFSVSGAFNAHYISICRWTPEQPGAPEEWIYEWGEDCYRMLTSEIQIPEVKDLAEVFDGYFQYLWETSGEPVFPTFKSHES
jgi:hypothetical protein